MAKYLAQILDEIKKHDDEGKILHKHTFYFKTPEHAHSYATKHGYPTDRIIHYGKGHAIQGGESGDYAGPHGLKVGHFPHGVLKPLHNESVTAELDAIYHGEEVLNEEVDEHGAHELVLHADNDHHLYHSSHLPIVKNLEKKHKKGIYNSEKAKKLWKYHADRAAQSYHHAYGDKSQHWKHAFSPATRRAAAAHWEEHHRHEMEVGNFHESVNYGVNEEQIPDHQKHHVEHNGKSVGFVYQNRDGSWHGEHRKTPKHFGPYKSSSEAASALRSHGVNEAEVYNDGTGDGVVNRFKRKKHYVGLNSTGEGDTYKQTRTHFTSFHTPTADTHGHLYKGVIGPFKTKKEAEVHTHYGSHNT